MAKEDIRLLELAIESLENKRSSIEEEIADLRSRLRKGSSKGRAAALRSTAKGGKKRRRRRMSAATRRALSESMKKRWAEKKRGRK
ncbi:MAG TPA: hypothetical protein VMM84_04765 [Pyrinomonadaceae bacterium]|nr:hypothetical protein [Pyrinomonadaceae bacterium]